MRALVMTCAVAVAACGGSLRAFPRWQLDDATVQRAGCVEGEALVRTSGKAGVGVTLALRSHQTCPVQITRAELVLAGQRIAATLPPPPILTGRTLAYLWLPFAFDNDAAWNADQRRGRFEIDLTDADGQVTTWQFPAHHDFVAGRWRPGPARRY